MSGRRSQIISSGINYVNTSTIGFIPKVASLIPPTVNNSLMQQLTDVAIVPNREFIQVDPSVAMSVTGLKEGFRTARGIVSECTTVAGVTSIRSTVLGGNTLAGIDGVAIGATANADVTNQGNIAIGSGASISGGSPRAIAIGFGASITQLSGGGGTQGTMAIGNSAIAVGGPATSSMAIGLDAQASREGISIGTSSRTPDNPLDGNLALGHTAISGTINTHVRNASLGMGCQSSNSWNTLIGFRQRSSGGANIIIGTQTDGSQRVETGGGNIIFGMWSGNGTMAGGDRIVMFGGNVVGNDMRTMIFGGGDTAVTPATRTWRFTNGSGANDAAGSIIYIAPRSTGNAVAGAHIFQVGLPAASSSTVQVATEVLRLSATAAGGPLVTLPGGAQFAATGAALTNYAAAAAGTLTNAPSAGNPALWIGVMVNGVQHAIPAWTV